MLRSISLLIVLLFALSPARAQTITGSITGTITDPAGAVVPNATVIAKNVDTNITTEAKTNAAGVYNLLFLPVGSYTISVQAPGFKTATVAPFPLSVNQTARIDVTMEVGAVTETVEVTESAPIMQTETAQTGDVISSTQATALPLNGRNFISLTLLVPGAITPYPNAFNNPSRSFGGGRPYVNGNREQTNNFLLDGVDINEPIDNLVAYNPNVDALAEMRVLTGNASAEFGNATGATVIMATKSGTNELHGNVFEFLRNDKLDSNEFFTNRSGSSKRALRQNIFGGTLGGPIRKDRLFFFVDYQGTRERDSGTALYSVVPAALRTGNLSIFPAGSITDPLTGQPFPGNIIPQSRVVNPVAQALFSNPKLYPLPNAQGTGPLGLQNNFAGVSANSLNNDQADAKIDFRATDKDTISGRFTIERYRAAQPNVVAFPALLGAATDAPTTGGVISWTRTISPVIVNEARVGFTRVHIDNTTIDPGGVFGANGNNLLGIPGSQPIPGASSVTVGDPFTSIGSAATDSSTVDNDYHYSDNLTIQHNRHLLKMGANFLRYQQNRFYAGNNGLLGNFVYDGTYTGTPYPDFLINDLASKGRGSQTGKWGHRQWRDGVFFQDDFKVRPNLTVNLGLRWEYTQPVYEVADREVNVDLQTGQPRFAGQNGNSRALFNPYYKQFMPRVGFAWTPGMFNNRFVVRAGYGITSFMEGTGANLRLTLNPPFFFESAVTYDVRTPGDIRLGFTDVQPQSQLAGQVRAWNPDLRPAFIQQWNFSTEYLITQNFSINAAYVGQKGTHLVDPREYNQPLPGTGPVETWAPLQQRRPLFPFAPLITNISGTDSSAIMNYHSFQLSGRKRLSSGLEFLASYTLSRTLTDNLGYYGSSGVAAEGAYWQNAYDRHGDYGPAFFDARHNFSLGGYWQLPFGSTRQFGKGWNRAADLVLGGWNLNFITSMHSGFPVTIQSRNVSNQLVRGSSRANRFGQLTYQNQNIDHWFGDNNALCQNPGENTGGCAYGVPALGQFGNSGKGTEGAPAFYNLDLAVEKQFHITERQYFDLRADFFNALNHPNFGPPARVISNPASFGAITSTVGTPRNIQLGLKYYF
jgi:hypothetical protein